MTLRHRLLVLLAALVLAAGTTAAVVVITSGEDPADAPAGAGRADGTAPQPRPVDPADVVRERLAAGATVLDVRTPEEHAAGHVEGAVPADASTDELDRVLERLPREASYVVYCASGRRAGEAAARMERAGFTDVVNGGGLERMTRLGAGTTSR